MALTLRHPLPGHNRGHQKLEQLFHKFFGHSEIPQHTETEPRWKLGKVIILGIVILLMMLLFT